MRYSAHLRGLSETTRYSRYVIDPPERTYPYALMTICDVQRHLVAARVLPRSGVDGIWGPQSKNALYDFIKTMPLATVRAVYTDNQDRGNIPRLGSREDYRLIGSTQIRIPQAYVLAFPPKANVPCTGGAQTTSTTVSSTEEQAAAEGQSATSTSTEVVEDSGPVVVDTEESARETESSSGGLWLMVAGLALGVIGIAAVRRKGQ